MIIGAIAAVAGIAGSVFGAVSSSSAQSKSEKANAKQAKANKLAAKKAAQVAKEILSHQKDTMDYNINVLKQLEQFQKAATEAVRDEQDARERELLYDAQYANEDAWRQFLLARGEAVARASEQTGGVGGSGVFGSLDSLGTSVRRAIFQTNLDVSTGMEIFSAQRDYADTLSAANALQTQQSINNMKSDYKEAKLRAKLGAAQIPATVARPAGQSAIGAAAGSIGPALVSASSSLQRFENQIFGTKTGAGAV